MSLLPLRATIEDVMEVCGYLSNKPTGASVAEARTVLDASSIDARKIGALKAWGLITTDEATGKMRLTERGRGVAKDKGARRAHFLKEAISGVRAYMAVIERAVRRSEPTVSATDVAAHWHQYFREEVSESDELINQQAICFFQLAEGGDLGRLVIGRRGQPTRFEFHEENASAFVDGAAPLAQDNIHSPANAEAQPIEPTPTQEVPSALPPQAENKRVFITHGKNRKILEQIKRTVMSVGLEPVVSVQSESAAKPVPRKVMDEMESCGAAVIHVGTEDDGKGHRLLNPNVLIEIGAAMMHCKDRFVLVVEDGVEVPSNIQGLYQCRYSGDGLDFDAGMKIQEALRGLRGGRG